MSAYRTKKINNRENKNKKENVNESSSCEFLGRSHRACIFLNFGIKREAMWRLGGRGNVKTKRSPSISETTTTPSYIYKIEPYIDTPWASVPRGSENRKLSKTKPNNSNQWDRVLNCPQAFQSLLFGF